MLKALSVLLLASSAIFEGTLASEFGRFGAKARQRQKRADAVVAEHMEVRDLEVRASKMRYLNKKTMPYQVKSLPDVNYNIGEMYAGSIDINKGDPSRSLFFAFVPKLQGDPVDEVTIWLNGGPGCSSLDGFFQENGPFVWQPGTFAPVQNQYSWANLTNMLWVDQPVGTGFAVGKPIATRQEETAAEFVKFFQNFQETFGIKNYKIYVTGESYAGRYVPYISAAILDQKNKTYFDLHGALMYDPCIGDFNYIQEDVVAVPYVEANANLFNFNETYMKQLQDLHQSCGYADYIDKYLQFPPSGMQPAGYLNFSNPKNLSCDLLDIIDEAAFNQNPCFDIYEITTMCPLPSDVLSFPTQLFDDNGGQAMGSYFNRTDVKKAFNAPMDVDWVICANENPFRGGDGGPESEGDFSLDPIQHVLPQVIQATNRVLVGNGDYDMIIISNGTLMSIQNMTWNGMMGFQSAPSTPIIVHQKDLQYAPLFAQNGAPTWDGPQGVMGIQHYERGLMWVETFQSGHMQPEFQPRVTLLHLEWLLGRIDSIPSK